MNRLLDRSGETDIHLELMISHIINYNTTMIYSQYFVFHASYLLTILSEAEKQAL